MSRGRRELEVAYLCTEYRVLLEGGPLSFFADIFDSAAQARLVGECGLQREWAILTPCNPQSERLSGEQNGMRLAALETELGRRRVSRFRALNHDPAGQWPDEPGFLLVDADFGWLLELGRRYRQNALLAAAINEAPRLVWL